MQNICDMTSHHITSHHITPHPTPHYIASHHTTPHLTTPYYTTSPTQHLSFKQQRIGILRGARREQSTWSQQEQQLKRERKVSRSSIINRGEYECSRIFQRVLKCFKMFFTCSVLFSYVVMCFYFIVSYTALYAIVLFYSTLSFCALFFFFSNLFFVPPPSPFLSFSHSFCLLHHSTLIYSTLY